MATALAVIAFLAAFIIFLIWEIRELGEKHSFFTTYPRQGMLGVIESGDRIKNILDGDFAPSGILYDTTKTALLGLYLKRKRIKWEVPTLKLNGEQKPTETEIHKDQYLYSIPKLFPVAVLAPVIAQDNLKGTLLLNFTFKVDERGEKGFIQYILNTPDWIDTLTAPLLALADEYAKKKDLLDIKGDDCVSLDKEFQKKFREISDKEHKVYKVMRLTLIGVELVNFIEDISPAVQEAFDEKARLEAKNAAALEYESGRGAILDKQFENANKQQDIDKVLAKSQALYAEKVTIPILNAGGDLTAAVIAAQKTNITTFAVGAGTALAIGTNNSSQQKPNENNAEEENK